MSFPQVYFSGSNAPSPSSLEQGFGSSPLTSRSPAIHTPQPSSTPVLHEIHVQSPDTPPLDRPAGVPRFHSPPPLQGFSSISPEQLQAHRDSRNITVREKETEYTIKAMTTSFVREDVPFGWKARTHPQGALYFFHQELRIFTDADLYDSRIAQHLDKRLTRLKSILPEINIELGHGIDLVTELHRPQGGPITWFHYFASHKDRSIFWLDDFDAQHLTVWQEVKGVTSPSQLRHEIESQYWLHCQLYPNARMIDAKLVDELRDIIMYAICDTLTSKTSTAPYNTSDLNQLLTLTDGFRLRSRRNMMGANASFSRLMHIFVRQRFYNFYGQTSARLHRDHSVYGHNMLIRSELVTLLSPILFYSPNVHLRALQKLWVDKLVHHAAWTELMNKITGEWQECILYATVLLNANVAFLTIQSVDSTSDSTRSPAQISSYISIIASVGCIVLGLLLVRQSRANERETAYEAARFLKKQRHPHGLETLAILYALPYSLLLYAIISFTIAFKLSVLRHTSLLVRIIVGSASLAVLILIVWCIITGWESRHDEQSYWSIWFSKRWKWNRDTPSKEASRLPTPDPVSPPRRKKRRHNTPDSSHQKSD